MHSHHGNDRKIPSIVIVDLNGPTFCRVKGTVLRAARAPEADVDVKGRLRIGITVICFQ